MKILFQTIRLLHFWKFQKSTFFTLKKQMVKLARNAEVQKSDRLFSHGLNIRLAETFPDISFFWKKIIVGLQRSDWPGNSIFSPHINLHWPKTFYTKNFIARWVVEFLPGRKKINYSTCAIITRGWYIFYPILKTISLFSRRFFSENSTLMYG